MSFLEFLNLEKVEEDEKKQEILLAKKLASETKELQEIMTDLNKIIVDSDIPIEKIDKNIIETNEIIKNTDQELTKAKQYQGKASVLKIAGICTLVGVCLGGPLGAIGGSYLGLALGGGIMGTVAGGSIAGGTAYGVTKKKQKQQELKDKLKNYEENNKEKIKEL